jgi:hypothetical protein
MTGIARHYALAAVRQVSWLVRHDRSARGGDDDTVREWFMPRVQVNGSERYDQTTGAGEPRLLIAGVACEHTMWGLTPSSRVRHGTVPRLVASLFITCRRRSGTRLRLVVGRHASPPTPWCARGVLACATALGRSQSIHSSRVVPTARSQIGNGLTPCVGSAGAAGRAWRAQTSDACVSSGGGCGLRPGHGSTAARGRR